MKRRKNTMVYDQIICGGTFDTLHEGHRAFLRFAFSHGEHVLIGLTSDRYVQTYKNDAAVSPYTKREKELEIFLQREHFLSRATIVAIDSKFDKTQVAEYASTALLVTSETEKTGEEINKERKKQGLQPLDLLVFPLVTGEKKQKISSSDIRKGLFDRHGIFLPDPTLLAHTLILSQEKREQLQKPFGELLTGDIPQKKLLHPEKIITVGDVTTKRLHQLGVQPKIAVVDFHVERKETHETLHDLGFSGEEKIIKLVNPAGKLGHGLWQELHSAIDEKETVVIVVDGEEDLLVIPLILMLPLGFTLFYGQPKVGQEEKGIVCVEITEEKKQQTYRFLKLFEHE